MTRTEIRFKALTFVPTLLLYERSVGQGIRSILITSSGSGVWAGCTGESRKAHSHFTQGNKRHLKALLPLIRFSLQYDGSLRDLSFIPISGVRWPRQPGKGNDRGGKQKQTQFKQKLASSLILLFYPIVSYIRLQNCAVSILKYCKRKPVNKRINRHCKNDRTTDLWDFFFH